MSAIIVFESETVEMEYTSIIQDGYCAKCSVVVKPKRGIAALAHVLGKQHANSGLAMPDMCKVLNKECAMAELQHMMTAKAELESKKKAKAELNIKNRDALKQKNDLLQACIVRYEAACKARNDFERRLDKKADSIAAKIGKQVDESAERIRDMTAEVLRNFDNYDDEKKRQILHQNMQTIKDDKLKIEFELAVLEKYWQSIVAEVDESFKEMSKHREECQNLCLTLFGLN